MTFWAVVLKVLVVALVIAGLVLAGWLCYMLLKIAVFGKAVLTYLESVLYGWISSLTKGIKEFFEDFAKALSLADHVILADIYAARETDTLGMRSSMLCEKIEGSECFEDFESIAKRALEIAEKGDLIITLGCGDIYKAANVMIKLKKEEKTYVKDFCP